MVVNGRVDESVRLAAIFGLNVKQDVSDGEIGIVPEDHDPCLLHEATTVFLKTYAPAARPEYFPEHLTGGVSVDIITLRP